MLEAKNCRGSYIALFAKIPKMFRWIADTIAEIFCRCVCARESSTFIRNIYGDEINLMGGGRSLWFCESCGHKWLDPYPYEIIVRRYIAKEKIGIFEPVKLNEDGTISPAGKKGIIN